MTSLPHQIAMALHSDAVFCAAVCGVLAESHEEADDLYRVFKQNASPAERKMREDLTGPEVRDILLHSARTAVRLLEGR